MVLVDEPQRRFLILCGDIYISLVCDVLKWVRKGTKNMMIFEIHFLSKLKFCCLLTHVWNTFR